MVYDKTLVTENIIHPCLLRCVANNIQFTQQTEQGFIVPFPHHVRFDRLPTKVVVVRFGCISIKRFRECVYDLLDCVFTTD